MDGYDDYATKPIDWAKLFAAITQFLERWDARDESAG